MNLTFLGINVTWMLQNVLNDFCFIQKFNIAVMDNYVSTCDWLEFKKCLKLHV